MARALVLYAHPRHQTSYGCAHLLDAICDLPQVTVRDLYEEYPDFYVDVAAEQALLREHDIVILLFPLYWYSAPSLLKEWQDRVLDFGFAYGAIRKKEQTDAVDHMALSGKQLWVVTTAGGAVNTFCEEGVNRHPLSGYLLPYEQMAHLCGMHWQEPFAVYRVRKLTLPYLQQRAQEFRERLLEMLEEDDRA